MKSWFFTVFRSLFFGVSFFCAVLAQAQIGARGASDIGDLKWWLGLKTGLTFSKVKTLESYSAVSNDSEENDKDSKKEYTKTTQNMGETIGVIFGYALQKNILITFQPSYSNYKYGYTTHNTWLGQNGDAYTLDTKQKHRLGYIELPVTLMFRFLVGNIEPYVHAGWYYGAFVGGTKKIQYTETLTEGGVTTSSPTQTEIFSMGNIVMKSQMGLTGGAGVAYTIQYFRIGLEVSYRQGMYNITNEKARYTNSTLVSKFFDVPDDLKLNQLEITLNLFMPVDNLIHVHSSQTWKGGGRRK
jgi:hypothetical protein